MMMKMMMIIYEDEDQDGDDDDDDDDDDNANDGLLLFTTDLVTSTVYASGGIFQPGAQLSPPEQNLWLQNQDIRM